MLLLSLGIFVVGLVLLVKGADFLVSGAASLAKKRGISPLVVGLTIVAFGTSAPELVVNLLASFSGNSDIAIGNVIGSNIANIFLILGITAAIFPLSVQKGTVWKEIPFSLLGVFVLAVLANDVLIDGSNASVLGRGDGLVLMAFFIIFLYYTFGIGGGESAGEAEEMPIFSTPKSLLMVIGGMIGLTVGGQLMIDSAVDIAKTLGISDKLIGLTIVAIGTSLPELATSVSAALKKQSDIAVGNVVGSNIFNVFWILGASATIRPLPFSADLNADIAVVIGATALLFIFLFLGTKHRIDRWQGGVFVGIYAAYLGYLTVRG